MEETKLERQETGVPEGGMRAVIREAIQEFISSEQRKAEPAYKTELLEERKRRELLERRVNELSDENRRNRQVAEEAERASAIRAELQRLGVAKVDLAFRAVKDDVVRTDDGRLVGRGTQGETPLKEFLTQFVNENPELLPARIPGGSGAAPGARVERSGGGGIDIDKIRPGMSKEELDAVRREIARIASQSMRGF
ncbi:MAG: hypothetical protein HY822_08550 [Acidobacteria bacterium]|nr:hypothetical protein [Acidobacteriota bacterium]